MVVATPWSWRHPCRGEAVVVAAPWSRRRRLGFLLIIYASKPGTIATVGLVFKDTESHALHLGGVAVVAKPSWRSRRGEAVVAKPSWLRGRGRGRDVVVVMAVVMAVARPWRAHVMVAS